MSQASGNGHPTASTVDEPSLLIRDRDALLRIAALVAEGAGQDEVFQMVSAEASTLIGVGRATTLLRFDGEAEDEGTVVGSSTGHPPVGTRVAVEMDIQGVPITINGRRWGLLTVTGGHPLPPAAGHRLRQFAGLVTGVVASAQAGAELETLADEQAALRRIHAVAGRGGSGDEVLGAIAAEGSAWLGGGPALLVRRSTSGAARVVAASGSALSGGDGGGEVDDDLVADVLASGRAARVDDRAMRRPGQLMQAYGMRTAVGVPVVVDGRTWGVFVAGSTVGPLQPDAERRLARFAITVTPTILSAEARTQLAAEQFALRRVAELVAVGKVSAELFTGVVTEASIVGQDAAVALARWEMPDSLRIVAARGARAPAVGTEVAVRREAVAGWLTENPSRRSAPTMPPLADRMGFPGAVVVPVRLAGTLWGLLGAGSAAAPLPAAAEQRLHQFAGLLAAGLANAQARQDLRMLAEEQAALGRVANLVVRGAALAEVFAAVATEASRLLGGIAGGLWRLGTDDTFGLVANANCGVTVGLRAPAYPGTPFGDLLRTGAPARIESFEGTPLADVTREAQVGPTATVPIAVEGTLWGAMTISTWKAPLPADVERRLLQFAELAGLAIANAENKAKLTTSRARVVATADETRRRLQRDVHDSAQQRLVHTIIALKLARQAIASGAPPAALVDEALVNAERANRELRDVVRGILPAALTRGGLRSGLESLLSDLVLPVELHVTGPRCPGPTELTAYFIIAEALTNVVKHARARRATVSVTNDGHALVLEVRDDGIGGADASRGTGLLGLVDRAEAADGVLTLTSPPGGGTALLVRLPLREASQPD